MRRCTYCGRRIFPWQRIGWLVLRSTTLYWHPDCKRKAAERD